MTESLSSDLALASPGRRLHVLTLTPFYPTALDDARGCFVAEPLQLMSNLGISHTVVVAVPFYRPFAATGSAAFPAQRKRYISLPSGIGLPTAGGLLFASLLRTVRELHRSNPIDVIHAHAALPCGHASALLGRELKIPFVVTVHGLDAYFTEQVAGRAGKWCEHVSKFVYRSAASVICISEKVRDRVLKGASSQAKTGVVYNGVDPEKFHPAGGNSKPDSILCVGNLIPTKGQHILLQALAMVHANFPEVYCELIGDGPERAKLMETAAKLNVKVLFRGRKSRAEVADAMQRCAIFALPSSYEGLGCVYLEAMASGIPPIGCRGQGIDEVIEHGANGWLVRPGSVEDLAHAISMLLQDSQLRQDLGAQARRTVLRGFTLAHQAEGLARIYRECAA
ncbi:MAG TPA: glycosyltransferase family 4 protein [Terriglobales bacterium]|nr:glycosyltransferase family 4 protein [Terriglobales bacterium]